MRRNRPGIVSTPPPHPPPAPMAGIPCNLNSRVPPSLVDDITYQAATKSGGSATSSAILGPFWRADTPTRENGTNISFDTPKDGQPVLLHGQVTSAATKKPLAGATVEVWQASTNGNQPMDPTFKGRQMRSD